MKQIILYNILLSQLKNNRDVDITVTGVSMEPALRAGDIVTIRCGETYEVGDILVFLYKNNELLVHRLLRIKDQRYFCKGDNAFRLEDVSYEQIFGKVIKVNGEDVPSPSSQQIELSYVKYYRKW